MAEQYVRNSGGPRQTTQSANGRGAAHALTAAMSPNGTPDQSSLDSRIIDVLGLNGQMPARQIARHLNLPEERVRQRLATLLSEGQLSVRAVVDLTAAGFEFYIWFFVQVEGAPVAQVGTALASIPEVIIVSM